jgi:CHAT domain-containing protein
VVLLVVLLAVPSSSSAAQTSKQLSFDESIEAAHGTNKPFRYLLDCRPGNACLVTIDQLGLDLAVSINSSAGSWNVNSPLKRDEREIVVLKEGSYEIVVVSNEFTGARGGHRIEYQRIDTGAPAFAVWQSMSQAARANADEEWQLSLDTYLHAAQLANTLDMPRLRAQALYSASNLSYLQHGAWSKAAALAEQASVVYSTMGQPLLAAGCDHQRAAALIEQAAEADHSGFEARAAEAHALYGEALALLAKARERLATKNRHYEVAAVENNVALTYFYMGEWDQARRHWRTAARAFGDLDEWSGERQVLANLAVVDGEDGHFAEAARSFQRILDTLPSEAMATIKADTLDNLGSSYRGLGEIEKALTAFSSALDIHRLLGNRSGEARSLGGIGETYYSIGRFDLATSFLSRALGKAEAVNDSRSLESILRYLGSIAYLRKDFAAAWSFHDQALAHTSSSRVRAHLASLIARDLRALREPGAALERSSEALAIAMENGSRRLEAEALIEQGLSHHALGDLAAADTTLRKALDVLTELGLSAQQADALYGLALVARSRGDERQALGYIGDAVARVEAIRGRLVNPELRAFYSARRHNYYELQISLRMSRYERAGEDDDLLAALTISERVRARMTLDLLNEAAINLRQSEDPVLSRRRAALYDRLAQRRHHRDRLLRDPRTTDEALDGVIAEITAAENELNLLEIRLRENTSRFAALSPPATLGAHEIQRSLDADTLLLQYFLGEEEGYLWLVTRDAVRYERLPPRAELDEVARRAFESLQTYSPGAVNQQAADLQALSAISLAPVASHLTKQRVLVAADGALQYIPFAALPVPDENGVWIPSPPEREFIIVPSLSALAGKEDRPPASKLLAAFSDPVFGRDDPRMPRTADVLTADKADESELRGGSSARDVLLRRLPATAREARAIAKLVPAESRWLASGFEANRDAVMSANLRDYRIIHFATHGRIDAETPALSDLMLSRFDDEGEPREGSLRLGDIYNLELNAELVVLSACDTALGREVRGEGLIGFSQGFFYAGARRLIATLWQVSDRATAELMTRFYRYLIVEERHPAAALRAAQQSIASEGRWRNPYFWSAFVLLGDWR